METLPIPKTFKEITPEHINGWKAMYNQTELGHLIVTHKGKQYQYVTKKPSRIAMDLIAQHGLNKDVVEANKALVANTVLGGDIEAMDADGGLYATVLRNLNVKAEEYIIEVKKL